MKTNKRGKLCSLLLSLLLAVTMMPAMAWADGGNTQNAENNTAHNDHCICGGSTGIGDHNTHSNAFTGAAVLSSTPTDSTLDEGTYYLTSDLDLTATLTISGNVTLCLNGHTMTGPSGFNFIDVKSYATLTITDCSVDKKGKITEGGYGVEVGNRSTFNLYGGTITKARYTGVNSKGTFNMYGGSITGNNTKGSDNYYTYPGGVNVSGGTFNMYGGIISMNKAQNGGGVYVGSDDGSETGIFNLYGGAISGNSASGNGGGVYVNQCTVYNRELYPDLPEHGEESGESQKRCIFNMYDGRITGNSSGENGGGVYVELPGESSDYSTSYGGVFHMTGGSITGNNANLSGGGVYQGDTMTVSGSAEIKNNVQNGSLNESNHYTNGTANNAYLCENKTITIGGALTDGTHRIGVTTAEKPQDDTPVQIATGTNTYTINATDKNAFFPDADTSEYEISQQVTNKLFLTKKSASSTHTHVWTYTANEATINAACAGSGACNFTGNTSLTLLAPAMQTFGDGKSASATIQGGKAAIGGMETLPDIQYEQKQSEGIYQLLSAAPADAGYYKASINIGEAIAYVEYTIAPAPITIRVTDRSAYVNDRIPALGSLTEGKDYTVSGLLGSDKLTTAPTLTYVNADGTSVTPDMSKAGEYGIRAGGADAGKNYTITYSDGKLTIASRPSSGSGSGTGRTEVITTGKTEAKVTTSPAEVKKETGTDAEGNHVTTVKASLTPANQREILRQAKIHKSGKILIRIAEKDVTGETKVELSLEKTFLETILKDTEAELTIQTAQGEKTLSREEIRTLTEAAEGSTVTIDPAAEEPQEPSGSLTPAQQRIVRGVENTSIYLKAARTKQGKILLTWTKSKGYKVDYFEFYRSVKKNKGYGKKPFFITKDGSWSRYLNTKSLKQGNTYYYKVRGVRIINGKKYYTKYSNKAWKTIACSGIKTRFDLD